MSINLTGRPRRKPRRRAPIRMVVLAAFLVLLICRLLVIGRLGPEPRPAEETTPRRAFSAGQKAVLLSRDGRNVWLAKAKEDRGALAEAEQMIGDDNGLSRRGALRTGLALQGRIRLYADGSAVSILETSGGWAKVTIVAGEDFGAVGWVQQEFLARPAR